VAADVPVPTETATVRDDGATVTITPAGSIPNAERLA
jgi:hypothetical protein